MWAERGFFIQNYLCYQQSYGQGHDEGQWKSNGWNDVAGGTVNVGEEGKLNRGSGCKDIENLVTGFP